MSVRFVDTNVLLYAVSKASEDKLKAERANAILDSRDVVLSVQVIQEFYVQATRPSRNDPLTHGQALTLIETFLGFPIADTTTTVVLAAIATRERFGISYWDAAIIESCRSLGCGLVLSEDLGDGQDYAGVRVENPFRDC